MRRQCGHVSTVELASNEWRQAPLGTPTRARTSSAPGTSPPTVGDEIPVPVESIAEDLLGLRIEEADLGDCSGMLIPAERLILVNASEAMSGDIPTRRHRFTIAHELGHWICHAVTTVTRRRTTVARRTCRGTPTAPSSERRTSSAPSC